MKHVDVVRLLAFANGLDQRQGTDDVKVQAWAVMFDGEAPDLEFGWAMKAIERHYAKTDDMLTPGHLVRGWHESARYRQSQSDGGDRDSRCPKPGCPCTHAGVCYKGWIDSEDGSTTSPCRVCREDLALVLDEVGPPGARTQADQEAIRNRVRVGAER